MPTAPASEENPTEQPTLLLSPWSTGVLETDQLMVDTDAWTALLQEAALGLHSDAQGQVRQEKSPLTPVGERSLRERRPLQAEVDETHTLFSFPLTYANYDLLFEGLAPAQHEWLEEDREIIRQTLEQLALALQDAYLFTSTQQALAEVERLYKATSQLLEGTTFEQALEVLAQYTPLGQAQGLYLYLPSLQATGDKDSELPPEIYLKTVWPSHAAHESIPKQLRVRPEAMPREIQWGLSLDAPLLPRAIREALQHLGARGTSVAPLFVGSDLVGALLAPFLDEIPALSPRERRITNTLLRQVASYVRSLALQENLRFTLRLTQRLYQSALGINQAESFTEILRVLWEQTPLGEDAVAAALLLFDPPLTEESSPTWAINVGTIVQDKWVQPREPRTPFAPTFEMSLLHEGPFVVEDPESEAILRTKFLAGQPHIVQNTQQEAVLSRQILEDHQQRFGARSGILVPLRVANVVIGMATAGYRHRKEWSAEDLQILMVAAAQAAVRVRSLYLLQVSERRARQLETVAVIARDIGRTLSLETLLDRAVNMIRDRFGFYHATVFLLDQRGEYAEARAATGEAGRLMLQSGHKLRVGSRSVVGQTAERGEPVVVNDVRTSPVHRPNPLLPETLAEAGFPLRVGERVIGVLDVQATQAHAFTADDVRVLQLLADQLAVAVENARAYELARRALEDMRRADELKSQFLASMSHELRTPLNSIIGFSKVILKGIDGPINDLQRQDLEAIFNAGQHLLGLINDILDLSKIEAGKMELNIAEVNVAEVVRHALATTQVLIKEKPVELVAEIEPDLPPLRVDPKRFRQILLNLLSNAAKFTKRGHIRVRAYREVDPFTAYSEIVIAVEDTGPGIAPDHVRQLFQPFYQVDSSLTREVEGTGLGLAITRNLVELHGGRIWVESEVGRGSTFYVAFPLTSGERATEDFLLVFDPEGEALKALRRHFTAKGYRVVQVQHLSELISRARSVQPLAVFINPFLPRRAGIEALLALKQREETRYLPAYFLAVQASEQQAFSPRLHVLLTKPVQSADITYLMATASHPYGTWLVVDRHIQHLQHMTELLREAGVERILSLEEWQTQDDAPLPDVFIWDILSTLPDETFVHTLQRAVREGPQHLVVGLFDAQIDAETGAQLEERLRALQKICTYPLAEALHYLERVLYHLGALRAASEASQA